MKKRALYFAVILLIFFGCAPRTKTFSEAANHCPRVDRIDIQEIVEILAHPALGGRGTTQPGFNVSGIILAHELRTAGIQPPPFLNGSYFQTFEFEPHYKTQHPFVSRNVLGYIPGTVSDEYIIIGAHYDHVGIEIHEGGEKRIYPGADDNASGTAAVLEIARILGEMSHAGTAFRRNIIVAFWGAEEFGLIGSTHFVNTNTIPPDKIVAVINLDMVGRNDRTQLITIGTKISYNRRGWKLNLENPSFGKLIMEENKKLPAPFNLDFEGPDNWVFRSDTGSFLFAHSPSNRKVPVVFFTTGKHEDYHRQSDTPEKIDYKKTAAVTCLALHILHRLATSTLRVEYADTAQIE